MATENILMAAVAAGGDRQDLHERIRRHSQAAAAVVKQQGRPNDLLERLAADPAFAKVDLTAALDPRQFIGLRRSRSTSSSPKWSIRFGRDTPTATRRKRTFTFKIRQPTADFRYGRPKRPSRMPITDKSSSRSGQCSPVPLQISSIFASCAGVAFRRRRFFEAGKRTSRPSSNRIHTNPASVKASVARS